MLHRCKASFILTIALCLVGCGKTDTTPTTSDYVMVTASHIDESYFPDYTLVYVDDDVDVAVYINNNYKPNVPNVGDKINLAGVEGVVEETDEVGFYVEIPENEEIRQGMSGTYVYDEQGNYVGFISAINEEGLVYCLCF